MPDQGLKLEFLQAGAGSVHCGCVHEKKTPFFIVAQAVSGWYEVCSEYGHVVTTGKKAFLMPPNTSMKIIHHGSESGTRMKYRYVHLQAAIYEAIDVFQFFTFPPISDNQAGMEAGRLIEEMLHVDQSSHLDRIMASSKRTELGYRILNLLLSISEPSLNRLTLNRMTQDLLPVLLYIRHSMREPISVDTMLLRANMSRTSLFHKFQACFNKTPMEYVKYVRLREAYNQLRTTSATVSEIADCCGFQSLAHFCREFKQAFQMTPGMVRKSDWL